MKKTNKILSILLVIAMMLTMAPISVFAASVEASGKFGASGNNLTWSLDSDGVLTISGSGAMEDFANVSKVPWYSKRTNVKTVIIESGVTNIGKDAFYGISSLVNATISDTVTSIGNRAFSGSGLTNFEFSDAGNLKTIGNSAFNSTQIKNMVIPDGVTTLGSYIFGYGPIKSVTIPASVTSIGNYFFEETSSLNEVIFLGNKEPETIGDTVFLGCSSLAYVSVPADYEGDTFSNMKVSKAVSSVAEVNGQGFATLADAISAAQSINGAELKLLSHISIDSGITIESGNFTIDLNGKELFSNGYFLLRIDGADVTIVDSAGGGIFNASNDQGNIVLEVLSGSANISGGTFNSAGYPATVRDGTLKLTGKDFVLNGNWRIGWYGGSIDLSACTADEVRIQACADGLQASAITLPDGWGLFKTDGTPCTDFVKNDIYVAKAGFKVTASVNPAEGGTVEGAGTYSSGATVNLTASAANGYRFVNWIENGEEVSTSAIYTFTASKNRELTANFEIVPHTHSFTYFASGDTITAVCENTDGNCPDPEGTLTIFAPTDTCTDGNAVVDNQLVDKSVTVNVVYSTDDGSVPTEDGTYTASVTLGDATATVEFTLGHDMIIDEAVAPTCTETGLTEGAHCSRCDEATTEQEIVPALGHDWSNKDGICANGCGENCEHENYIDGVCDYCGYECTHDWNEGVLTRPERITTTEWYDGYYTYTCTLCGDEKTETAKRADYTEFEETYSKVLGYLNGSDLTNEAKAEIHDAVQDYLSANPEFNDNGNVRGTLIESEQAIVDDATTFAKQILAIIEGNLTNCESGNHDVRSYTSNNNATCTEDGTKRGNCYVCGEEVVETDENNLAFDHDYDYENGVLTRPTETEKGYYTYTCKNDTNHTTTKEVDSADYTEYDKAAQKIAGYFSTPNLTDASKQLIIAELNKFAQNNSEYCDKNGNLRRDLIASEQDIVDNATRAANELIQVVDGLLANCEAGNHDVRKYTSDNNVTCTENGTKRGNCVVCGEEVTVDDENAPAPGHDMITDEAVEPTCTETGLTEGSHCSRCDEATTEQEFVPALGHDMITDEAVEPTCTETGLTEGEHCSRCDEATTEQEIVPALGHTPLDAVEENYVAPDCTNDGSKDLVVYCDVCDEELEREPVTIPALGHDMITDEAVEPTCTETGLTKGAHCSRCDEATTEQEVIDALGHDYETVVTAPTCTEDGYTTYTCTVCGDTYTDDETDALGHTPLDTVEENYIAPTCTENGSVDYVVYCDVCDAEISRETETIEATGHADNDNDGYCDDCEENLCNHACHKGGIRGFFWRIIKFFYRLLNIQQYCDCGNLHYEKPIFGKG